MEILVLGDGRFMAAVLNAVASIQGYGQLAAAGGLVGLVLMLVKGVVNPSGPQLNIPPILLSIVFFWVMFVPRVDRVLVTEVMTPPGQANPRQYVVDNVPFGVAAAGYFVSNVGLNVTGLYDQIMGRATDSERVLTGGMGRNIMLLAHIQAMVGDARFGEGARGGKAGDYDFFRANMLRYMTECVAAPVNSGYIEPAVIKNRPLEEGVLGPIFATPVRSTGYARRAADGKQEVQHVTCQVANERLNADAKDPKLLESFDAAAQASRANMTARELADAFASLSGQNVSDAHHLVVGHMVSALLTESQLRGALTPQAQQAIIMLEEANLRRATQWAAEENLFVRVLRPTIGFFEALFYALAPVMAFVVMLGPTGWGLVGKYLMLTVWVMLWFPMLSIANLYSKMRMEDFFAQLGDVDRFTPAHLELVANEAITTLGATSALIAATPALAMSLIYGGAVAMSAIAGRLQHSDVVDENKVAPNAQGVGAVMQAGAMHTHTEAGGAVRAGGQTIKLSEAQYAEAARASAETHMHEATEQASKDVFQAISNGARFGTEGTHYSASAESLASANDLQRTLSKYEGEDQQIKRGRELLSTLSAEQTALAQKAFAYAQQHGVSFQVGLQKVGNGFGVGGSFVNTITETTQTSDATSQGERMANSDAIMKAMSYGFQESEQVGSSFRHGLSQEVGDRIATSGATYASAEDGERVSRSLAEVSKASAAYTETHSAGWRVGRQSDMTVMQFATELGSDGLKKYGDAAAALIDRVPELAARREEQLAAIQQSDATLNPVEQGRMAAIMTLMEQSDRIPASYRAEANSITVGALRAGSTFTGGGAVSAYDASANSGLGQGVAERASAAVASAAALGGAGISAETVRQTADGRIGAAGGATAAQGAGLAADGTEAGITGGGLQTLGALGEQAGYRDWMNGEDGKVAAGQANSEAYQSWEVVGEMRRQDALRMAKNAEENPLPEPAPGVFGAQPPSLSEYVTRVNEFTAAAAEARRFGFEEEAQRIEAARETTIEAMVDVGESEAQEHQLRAVARRTEGVSVEAQATRMQVLETLAAAGKRGTPEWDRMMDPITERIWAERDAAAESSMAPRQVGVPR